MSFKPLAFDIACYLPDRAASRILRQPLLCLRSCRALAMLAAALELQRNDPEAE